MSERLSFNDEERWNELVITDSDGERRLVVSRGFLVGAAPHNPEKEKLVAVEFHTGDNMQEFYLTFGEAVDIFKHVLVLYKEHEEAGDFK